MSLTGTIQMVHLTAAFAGRSDEMSPPEIYLSAILFPKGKSICYLAKWLVGDAGLCKLETRDQ